VCSFSQIKKSVQPSSSLYTKLKVYVTRLPLLPFQNHCVCASRACLSLSSPLNFKNSQCQFGAHLSEMKYNGEKAQQLLLRTHNLQVNNLLGIISQRKSALHVTTTILQRPITRNTAPLVVVTQRAERAKPWLIIPKILPMLTYILISTLRVIIKVTMSSVNTRLGSRFLPRTNPRTLPSILQQTQSEETHTSLHWTMQQMTSVRETIVTKKRNSQNFPCSSLLVLFLRSSQK
jgi:hypothetical protein